MTASSPVVDACASRRGYRERECGTEQTWRSAVEAYAHTRSGGSRLPSRTSCSPLAFASILHRVHRVSDERATGANVPENLKRQRMKRSGLPLVLQQQHANRRIT